MSEDRDSRDAGIQFGMGMLKLIPRDDKPAMEAHITGVLIVFWGALWGAPTEPSTRGDLSKRSCAAWSRISSMNDLSKRSRTDMSDYAA